MIIVVIMLVGAGLLLILGNWARKNIDSISSVPGMEQGDVAHRRGVFLRGAIACYAVAGILGLAGVYFIVSGNLPQMQAP